MATTAVPTFEGTPTLDDDKIETLMCWLAEAMADMDKACDAEGLMYSEGVASGLKSALSLLYDLQKLPK